MFGHAQYNLYNIFTILNHYKYRCLNIFFTTISHLIFDISNTTKIEQSRILRIPEYCVLDMLTISMFLSSSFSACCDR